MPELTIADCDEFKALTGGDWTLGMGPTGKLFLYHIHHEELLIGVIARGHLLYTVLGSTKKCRSCGKESPPYVWVLYKTWLLKDCL